MATVIAGGTCAAIPHQATVMKLALPSTSVPTRTAGMGKSNVLGPIFIFSIVYLHTY
jgi:hypothetical protein